MGSVLSEWGMAGIEALRNRVAVSRGAAVYLFPHGDEDGARAAADRVGAVLARPRRTPGEGFSLSPVSLLTLPTGTKLVPPSPNGSRLSLACGARPVLAGCLRNAAAVARTARAMSGGGAVGVIPAGERWPDGSLRPAIEDLLGSGAVIHHLALPCSPEAQVARDALRAAGEGVSRLIRASISGCELADRGFDGDVALAVEQDVSAQAPLLTAGAYRAA